MTQESRRSNSILRWLAATLAFCSACAGGAGSAAEAGPFSIARKQQSYRNWDTGSRTTYYTYRVRYRGRDFSFPVRYYYGSSGDVRTEDSSRIARAFVVSVAPASILVLAGDPNNDASWTLLRDTPQGLEARHVAYYADGDQLAWLDGSEEKIVENPRELLRLDGGRWLWVGQQALLDRESLQVHELKAPEANRYGAAFVAFSPDRRRMARFSTQHDPRGGDRWQPVILVNDIASGSVTSIDIDAQQQWFDDSRDIDRNWLMSYFEWGGEGGVTLLPRKTPAVRPYHGRLGTEPGSGALQYHAPRVRFDARREVMDVVAAAMGASYTMEEPMADAPAPPPATAVGDASVAVSDRRTDVVAPSVPQEALVRADLHLPTRTLAVYFSSSGVSIENREPELNAVVTKIAAVLDRKFAGADAQRWISMAGVH